MRLAVRTCYDFCAAISATGKRFFTELTEPEADWLERFVVQPDDGLEQAEAARQLVDRILSRLPPERVWSSRCWKLKGGP